MSRREPVYVGTAGWALSRSEQPRFDAGVSLLARYATRLPAVEINSPFYRVAADPPRAVVDAEPSGWTGIVYYRLHGSPKIYYSAYDDAYLTRLSERLADWRAKGSTTWCIFDNSAAGAAVPNALELNMRVNVRDVGPRGP